MKHDFEKGWLVGALTGLVVGIMGTALLMTAVCAPSKIDKTTNDTAKANSVEFRNTVLPNGCFLAASGFKDAYEAQMQLQKRAHWASLMYVNIVESTGHAICVFIYDGRWKAYDNLKGTVDLGEWILLPPTPVEIAAKLNPNYKDAQWYK